MIKFRPGYKYSACFYGHGIPDAIWQTLAVAAKLAGICGDKNNFFSAEELQIALHFLQLTAQNPCSDRACGCRCGDAHSAALFADNAS